MFAGVVGYACSDGIIAIGMGMDVALEVVMNFTLEMTQKEA